MLTSDWLTKPRTARLFLVSSVLVLVSGAFAISLYEISGWSVFHLIETSTVFKTLCGLLGVVTAPAGIYVFVGMLWYWARLDTSSRFRKALWFMLFLTTGFIGLAIYSLSVYRKQVQAHLGGTGGR
jgi:uncharacterized membrane protein